MEGDVEKSNAGSSGGIAKNIRHRIEAGAEHIQGIYEVERAAIGTSSSELIHRLFERQVERTPESLAVNDGVQSLAYSQLNAKANRLARHLVDLGVGPESLVALCLDRTTQVLVGLLAVLKAGGAYLPLDPTSPVERLAYMLSDSEPLVILTSAVDRGALRETSARVVLLDDEWHEIERHSPGNLSAVEVGSENQLAYVIYTSGSTGQPKGVMVEHRNVANHWRAIEKLYSQPFDCRRIGVNAPFTFDASVQQYVQLLSGRSLFLIPQSARLDARNLINYIVENRIDGIDCTPSQLSTWVSAGLLERQNDSPRTVLVGGEAIDPQLWNRLSQCRCISFYNVYGPTECTVDSTAATLSSGDAEPHIGRPLHGTRIHILDELQRPVPVGVKGEIFVGGAGVSRGYLRRPKLTEAQFLRDPLDADPEARIYRTGDFGCWRADGNIQFLGRIDGQVKIRGFRIELGEIEAQIARDESVKEVVVAAREDVSGDRRLVAYVTERVAEGVNVDRLRARLRDVLPAYMMPSAFVVLSDFGRTANGKLDRRSLPPPKYESYTRRQFVPPEGVVETHVARIWSELLGVQQVGRDDDFFELGGNSIVAMKLILRLDESLAIQFPFASVYEHSTLSEMVRATAAMPSTRPSLPVERSAIGACPAQKPLSFQQEWIWSWLETNASNCLMPFALKVTGGLDVAILNLSLQALEARHDSLRMRVINSNGVRRQFVAEAVPVKVGFVELNGTSDAELGEQAQVYLGNFFNQSLDLAAGPPFAVALLKLGGQQFVLAIVFHHIIADATSVTQFFQELWQFYDGLRTQGQLPIQKPALQYADYVDWQMHEYGLRSEATESYWRGRLEYSLRLVPSSAGVPAEARGPIAFMSFRFGKTTSVALSALAKQERSTLAMVALALYAVRMSSWLGQDEVMIPFIVAGRTRSAHVEAVGLYSHPLFLRVVVGAATTFRDFIHEVSREFRIAFEHLDFGKFASERRDLFLCPTVQWLASAPDGPSTILRPLQSESGADFQVKPYPVRMWWQDTLRVETAIGMQFWEAADGICGQGYYRADLFSANTMDQFANGLRLGAEKVADQPQMTLASLSGDDPD
jgi:amino acid adenylation domain-containing protein